MTSTNTNLSKTLPASSNTKPRKISLINLARIIEIASFITLSIIAGNLRQAMFSNDQGDPMESMLNGFLSDDDNKKYLRSLVLLLALPCAHYLYELVRVLDWRREKGPALHHIVSLLMLFCAEMSGSGILLASLCFFFSDCAALPIFLLDWRGKVVPTMFVTLNYTIFRIPFIYVMVRGGFFIMTTSARENVYLVGMSMLMPLIVVYSVLNVYKLWQILLKTVATDLRTKRQLSLSSCW